MKRKEDTMLLKYLTIKGSLDNIITFNLQRNNQQFVPISKRTVQLKSHVLIVGQTQNTNNIINLLFIYIIYHRYCHFCHSLNVCLNCNCFNNVLNCDL